MVSKLKTLQKQRVRRRFRVRKRFRGTAETPRLTVFRSNSHIYCQLIDDVARKTIASASTRDKALQGDISKSGNKDAATAIGQAIAKKALDAGIQSVCFDRGAYRYHGRVAALADAAREAGLKF